ncbi:MAG TPA: ferritin-like domain-containing protein [Acidimicrobiales bacterium]|nr:ferritin-like domain-containing protein [Acidimicrobiales bacterium]
MNTPDQEATMTDSTPSLAELLEESQDLQADALRPTRQLLHETVELADRTADDPHENVEFHRAHRTALSASLGRASVLGAAGGVALVGALASAASARSSTDVQILQTAASIENLAVSTYKTALTLPYIGGSAANPVVTKFCQVTMGQHAQHADAFNAATAHLGGKVQKKPDPTFVPVVNKAVASLGGASAAQGALGVVGLALELENVAAETYVHDTVLAKSTSNKALFASIMGIEAQHVSVLRAVQALLMAGAPQLISLAAGTAASLPAVAGSVGFPDAFYKTNDAAPATQGAIK